MGAIAKNGFQPLSSFLEFSDVKSSSDVPVLNSLVTNDPISNEIFDRRLKLASTAAAIALTVFSIVGPVLTLTYTATYHLVHLPVVCLIIGALNFTFFNEATKHLWSKSAIYDIYEARDASIARQVKNIDDATFETQLKSLGVNPGIDPKNLKNLFGQYLYFIEERDNFLQNANQAFDPTKKEIELPLNNEIIKVNPEDFKVEKIDYTEENRRIFTMIQGKKASRNNFLESAASESLRAAYLLKLMQSPYEQRGFTEFFQFNPLNTQDSRAAKYCGDKRANILIKTPKKTYTSQEILNKDIPTLAREIFELPKRKMFYFF